MVGPLSHQDLSLLIRTSEERLRDGDLQAAQDCAVLAMMAGPTSDAAVIALSDVLEQRTVDEGLQCLHELLTEVPQAIYGWLLLGRLREFGGDRSGALRAYYEAVTRAQVQRLWLDEASTPVALTEPVVRAIRALSAGRRELYASAYERVRASVPADELRRVDHALSIHLSAKSEGPPSPHQRPRFFYFPGLPAGPYHDPWLQPWTGSLVDAWTVIRDEASLVLREDEHFDSYFGPASKLENHLRSSQGTPAWDALFFYRHGLRFDTTHQRCPETSRLLESIDLCRIDGEAPEICFSLLAPHTEILPHHGVSNIRLVFHLPLIVPDGCALQVDGGGEHQWQAGQPMLFDDTYRHSAWNRSDQPRLILLMDCWNPHLRPAEREAVRLLLETIGGLGRAARAARAP